MTYNITTISIGKFATIWIVWLLSFIILFVLFALSHAKLNELFFAVCFVIVFFSGLIIALRFSGSNPKLILTEEQLEYENSQIKLADIDGYYINNESLVMIEIELRTKQGDYKITAVSYGEKGRNFKLFLKDFVEKSNRANKDIKELGFYDFHNKQYILIRTTIYFQLAILILLNLFYFYLIFVKKIPFNWKLLYANFLFVWLYKFHRKNEKKRS
jgi:hypothetical protein